MTDHGNIFVKSAKAFFIALADSYSCIIFTHSPWFGLLVMISTFLSPIMGLSGLIGSGIALLLARALQFDVWDNHKGFYGFNSMLTSLAVAYYFPGDLLHTHLFLFSITLFFASVISLFLFVFLQALWNKLFTFNSLSLSFSITAIIIWMFFYKFGFNQNHSTTEALIFNPIIKLPIYWQYYFQSLGSIFFMPSTLVGILIAFLILIQSRLNLILTVIGYSICYVFVDLWISDVHQGILFYGFNSILIALALGGVYILPDLIAWLFIAFSVVFGLMIGMVFQHFSAQFLVPVFTIPFCFTSLIMIYTLKLRLKNKYPYIIDFNIFIPERSLEYYYSKISRFGQVGIPQFYMPLIGEWTITQGHHGKYTHRYNQAYAYDFEVLDHDNNAFSGNETDLLSYYSYGKPVYASAPGYVSKVMSGVEDNPINRINAEDNWGNYVTIYHGDSLYTLYAHLKNNSINVKEGDYIYCGDKIAQLGNSGRSAVPHLHFQVQTSYIPGCKTICANIVHYKKLVNNSLQFVSFGNPQTRERISSFSPVAELQAKLHFLFYQKNEFVYMKNNVEISEKWHIDLDFNNVFRVISSDGTELEFSVYSGIFNVLSIKGRKKNVLSVFGLLLSRLPLTEDPAMSWHDSLPLSVVLSPVIKNLLLFLFPLFKILKFESENNYEQDHSIVKISSRIYFCLLKRKFELYNGSVELDKNTGIKSIILFQRGKKYLDAHRR